MTVFQASCFLLVSLTATITNSLNVTVFDSTVEHSLNASADGIIGTGDSMTGQTESAVSIWHTVKGSMMIGDAPDIVRGPEAHCPPGHVIIGFMSLTESEQGGGDDTALNAVGFLCSDNTLLRSAESGWGNVGNVHVCLQGETWVPLTGIILRMEPTHETDATGAVNMQAICQDSSWFDANDYTWGKWVEPATICEDDHHFCGFASFVQNPQDSGDDLGMVGMVIECCPKILM